MKRILPKGFLWRLSLLNIIVMAIAIGIIGWAIYYTACFLVDGIGNPTVERQAYFNSTLFQYLVIFSGLGILVTSIVHFYLTKKIIRPIHHLIESIKMLKQGSYPPQIKEISDDEIGELITHYNELIVLLKKNELQREKLVADISHELRTPMANISGYLEALKSGHLEAEPILFNALHEQSMQIINLIEQIEQLNEWNLQTDNQLSLQEVPIKQLIEQCAQLLSLDLDQSNKSLEINVIDTKLCIHREGIQQVLNNLLHNAVRYAIGEGTIKINGKKLKNNYSISVISPGVEIKENDRERIFERFYRVENSRNRKLGGSGLGLSIAKEIVENHHGTLTVSSEHNKNIFTVTIPQDWD